MLTIITQKEVITMIQLNTLQDTQQFITIQPLYFGDTAIIQAHLLNKYPEMEQDIYAVDEEELLIQCLPFGKAACPMPLKDLIAAAQETGVESLIALVVASDTGDEYCREYVRYF